MPNLDPIGIALEAVNNASKAINQAQKDLEDLGKTADETNKKQASLGAGLKKTGAIMTNFGKSAALIGAALSIGLTAPLVKLGKTMVDQVSSIEQYKISLDTMLGSVEEGSKLLNEVQQFAAKTPFQFPEAVNATKQLLAFGIAQKDLLPTLKSLGDVAAGLSVPIEQLGLAYGQVRAANQLYGTELRQFVNAGVPILQVLADQFGKTEAQVKKMVEEGQVGFADVEEAFRSMSDEGGRFFNLMEAQSKTFSGILSNIEDNFIRVSLSLLGLSTEAENFGEIIEGGAFDKLKDIAQSVLDGLDKLVVTFSNMSLESRNTIVYIVAFTAALGPALLAIGALSLAIGAILSGGLAPFVAALYAVGVALIAFRDQIGPVIDFLKSPFVVAVGAATAAMLLFNQAMRATIFDALTIGGLKFVASIKNLPAILTAAKVAVRAFGAAVTTATGLIGAIVFSIVLLIGWIKKMNNEYKELVVETATLIEKNDETIASLNELSAAFEKVSVASEGEEGQFRGVDIEATKDYLDLQNEIAEKELALAEIRKIIFPTEAQADFFLATKDQLELDKELLEDYKDGLIDRQEAYIDAEGNIVTAAQKFEELKEKINEDEYENAVELYGLRVERLDELGQEIIEGEKTVSDGKLAIIKAFNIEDARLLNELLELDDATAKKRLQLAQQLGISQIKLQAELLDYNATASDEEVRIYADGLARQEEATKQFVDNLKPLLGPEVKDVAIDIRTFLDGEPLQKALTSGTITSFNDLVVQGLVHIDDVANAVMPGVTELYQGFKDEIVGIQTETQNSIDDFIKASDEIGGVGGAASKSTEELDNLGESLEDLGVFAIREGGKVVDTFDNVEDGAEKISDRLEDLTESHSEFLESVSGVTEDINNQLEEVTDATDNVGQIFSDLESDIIDTGEAVERLDNVVDTFEEIDQVVQTVTDSVEDLKDAHNEFIDDAKTGLEEFSDSLKEVNSEFDELADEAREGAATDLVEGYVDAVDRQKEITEELVEAQEDLNEAISDGNTDRAESAQDTIDALNEELQAVKDYQSTFNEITSGAVDYEAALVNVNAQIEEAQENVDALNAAGNSTTAAAATLAELEKERLIILGQQQIAQEELSNIEEQLADQKAKDSLSEADYIAYLLGKELDAIEEKRAAEIKRLEDIKKVQEAIVSGAIADLDIDELRAQGFSEEAIDLALNAQIEEANYQASLSNQLAILEAAKAQEITIYEGTRVELEAQQALLEEYLTLSYDRLIGKLQEVETAAKAALAAQNAVSGGDGSSGGGAGFAEGGYTGSGGKHEVAGVVHKGEWVAPAWQVRAFKPLFSSLENLRKTKNKGFAEGGFTSPQVGAPVYNQPIVNHNNINNGTDARTLAKLMAWQLRTS